MRTKGSSRSPTNMSNFHIFQDKWTIVFLLERYWFSLNRTVSKISKKYWWRRFKRVRMKCKKIGENRRKLWTFSKKYLSNALFFILSRKGVQFYPRMWIFRTLCLLFCSRSIRWERFNSIILKKSTENIFRIFFFI